MHKRLPVNNTVSVTARKLLLSMCTVIYLLTVHCTVIVILQL